MKPSPYFAVTQPTASWLLTNTPYLRAVTRALSDLAENGALMRSVLGVGALRVATSRDGRICCIWNIDYLSNKGEESWAILQATEPCGLLGHGEIIEEVLERMIFVANQRLQGLIVDPAFILRHFDGNVHTCIAGRGADARQYRVGWSEQSVQTGSSQARAITILGPTREADDFHDFIRSAAKILPALAQSANSLLTEVSGRPPLESSLFSDLIEWLRPATLDRYEGPTAPPGLSSEVSSEKAFEAEDWTYDAWTDDRSPLTTTQKNILNSDLHTRQPLRIVGAAGSGKTLLIMLLAIRRLVEAESVGRPLLLLYIAHNAAMAAKTRKRFSVLGAERFLQGAVQTLRVTTLLDHSRAILGTEDSPVIHTDAFETKRFQREFVAEAFSERIANFPLDPEVYPFLGQATRNEELRTILVNMIADEISTAIKGHGLGSDRKRYVESDRRLSRLHGILTVPERTLVFDVFEAYQLKVFETLEVLDCDDIAVSLLARLLTPVWEMKRRKSGCDWIFVDEAQLFNENERRLFPLLTRGQLPYVPAVLAMDEAQQVRATSMPGLGLLGFDTVASETLQSVHRSSPAIIRLAFHVIQRTTDLFGPDFPDFTAGSKSSVRADHPLVDTPRMIVAGGNIGTAVLRQVQALRRSNIRQIAVLCHAERYWEDLIVRFQSATLPLLVLEQRGERFDDKKPIVVLARPETIGGQEFDAVVCIGLEQGVTPPRIDGNPALAAALDQQSLREMYLSFTRARYRLVVALSNNSAPTSVLASAVEQRLIELESPSGPD